MECGSDALACQLIGLLAQHGIEAAHALDWLPWVERGLRENVQAIVGLLGFAFGIWRWWYYNDRVLHNRLLEYLSFEEQKLKSARDDVLAALFRPGARRSFAEPLFAVAPLREALKCRRWDATLNFRSIENYADRRLDTALNKISERLETATAQAKSFHAQKASAHLLKGAIAAAKAGQSKSKSQSIQLDMLALSHFEAVLTVPGFETSVEASTYRAHELRKLGYLQKAAAAYEALELAIIDIEDNKEREFALARAMRWRAVIAQARAIRDYQRRLLQGETRPGPGSMRARDLMMGVRTEDDADAGDKEIEFDAPVQHRGALELHARHGLLNNWDAIEHGDMHYFTAYVYNKLTFPNRQATQLSLAKNEYEKVLSQYRGMFSGYFGWRKRLRQAAQAGLSRVNGAEANNKFDTDWLLPPLQPPQPQSNSISHPGS